MSDEAAVPIPGTAVARYKLVLMQVLDMRQRLAQALGKSRSFISQIANPTYPTPIPAQHLQTIFEICHFSLDERRAFLKAYAAAHPRRSAPVRDVPHTRVVTVTVPDSGDARINRVMKT